MFGVFTSSWLVSDAIAVPLTWMAYVPFLIFVLERDSRYWARCGFSACVLGLIGEGEQAGLKGRLRAGQDASTAACR